MGDAAPAAAGPGAALARALEAFAARPRVLVAVDFDGTLAPIVEDPADARPLPLAARSLAALAGAPGTHVVVVSGRPLAQLRGLVGAVPGAGLVGSHGAEIETAGPEADGAGHDGLLTEDERGLLARVREAVARIVAEHDGTALEEKPAAAVLHTRTAGREAAIAATADALQGPGRWPGVHALRGKEVVELAVTDVTKGAAVRRLRAGLGLDTGGVLYAGDDTTDEHAFAALDDDGGDVTVKVGAGRTAARHRVAGPEELADLLAELARRRT